MLRISVILLIALLPVQIFGQVIGDVNQDGRVDFQDVGPFISVLTDSAYKVEADTNQDSSVNFLDIQPFIFILQNQMAISQTICVVGDSFYASTAGISQELVDATGWDVDYSNAVSGSTLGNVATIVASKDFSSVDALVISRGINDIAGQGDDLATLQAEILAAIAAAPADVPVVVANITPGSNVSSWNATREATRLAYNSWLANYVVNTAGLYLLDQDAIVDADQDGNIDPAYDQGPGDVHPRPAYPVIAEELEKILKAICGSGIAVDLVTLCGTVVKATWPDGTELSLDQLESVVIVDC